MIALQNCIFDTQIDTNKIFVPIKTKFVPRKYINADGKSLVYLHVTTKGNRNRIPLNLYIDPKKWDCAKSRIRDTTSKERDLNLILDNYQSKITNIKTIYRLSEKILTPRLLIYELKTGLIRVDFIPFFKQILDEEKSTMKKGTWKRYNSVYNNLEDYQSEIIFTEIDSYFFKKYRKHLLLKNRALTTVNANIGGIKKYLRVAVKMGIKIPINLDDIKVGSTNGNRSFLLPSELIRANEYYFSNFINPTHKLILGYFLFGCMTGLRISDIQKLKREYFVDGQISFIAQKTEKYQLLTLNKSAQNIIEENEELFVKKYEDQFINRELKKIFSFLKIYKKITFHVSRHTFATSFLRVGGSVQKLQILLGHSKIDQTMIYVHVIAEEANKEMFLLDKLFE